MPAYFSVLSPRTFGVIDVGAIYSDGVVERAVIDHLRREVTQAQRGDCLEVLPHIVEEVHKLFVTNGDRDENRARFRAEPFQWYMATCEMALAIVNSRIGYLQIG